MSNNLHDTQSQSHRIMISSCSVAIAALVPVALFQCGALDHLPDPPASFFASDQITSSSEAHPFGVPDSLLGLASYGTTLTLALNAPHSQFARKVLKWKLLLDGSMAAVNTAKQFIEFRSACSWCMLTAAATVVMVTAGYKYLNRPTNSSCHNPNADTGCRIRPPVLQ